MKTMVFLIYIATQATSGGYIERYTPMTDMNTCLQAVGAAKIEIPQGGDAETTVTLFCTTATPTNPNRPVE